MSTRARRWLWAGAVVGAVFVFVSAAVLAWRSYQAGGWRRHTDTAGFVVEVPAGSEVRTDPASGRIEIRLPGDERLVVWPLFAPSSGDDRATGRLLSRVARGLWPAADWDAPGRVAPGTWRVRGAAGDRRGVCLLHWVPTSRGAAGYVFLTTAAASAGQEAEPRLARVLASFRLSGAPAPAAPAIATPRRHMHWRDPREGAFSVDVPEGWRAQGGTIRPNPLLVRARVDVASPDGQVQLLLGDAFPIHVEPNLLLAQVGIGPGGTYVDSTGTALPVARYAPGVEYALAAVVPSRVGAFELVRRTPRPDLARRLVSLGINRFDAEEAEYRFRREGRAFRGWVLGITERVAAPAVTHWHMWRLALAEAPADRFDEAAAALVRLAGSFRVNPDWARRQARLTAEQSRILNEMGDAASRTLAESHQGRQDTLDEIHRRSAEARLEVERTVDSRTGREITVASGSRYYWVDDRGTVVGTETDTRPALDFRELVRLP